MGVGGKGRKYKKYSTDYNSFALDNFLVGEAK